MKFIKYQGLGNDYIILDPVEGWIEVTPALVRRICDRHYGAGSDGVLWGPQLEEKETFSLHIFNPDGSVVEKSGNGLRIFSRYLWDLGKVQLEPFSILTLGGQVVSRVHPGGGVVTVEMGQVSFDSQLIPVAGNAREVLNETIQLSGHNFTYCAVTLGNPHCVVLVKEAYPELARQWGPQIEREERFPRRTNVQFMQVIDRNTIRIEIWERGAGYTLASGSSSCAAAATAYRLGLCDENITARMPGGELQISIAKDYAVTLTGPVEKVYEGEMEL